MCLSFSIIHLFSFFLIIPPPPSSTLFPYTTLFRSLCVVNLLGNRALREAARADEEIGASKSLAPYGIPCNGPRYLPAAKDRKSTRLNSSHVSISYAVFCLKKKKKNKNTIKLSNNKN